MFDHMSNLSLHSDEEENDEVQQKDRPEHRNIEYFEESHDESRKCATSACIPKFKFRKASSKWSISREVGKGS